MVFTNGSISSLYPSVHCIAMSISTPFLSPSKRMGVGCRGVLDLLRYCTNSETPPSKWNVSFLPVRLSSKLMVTLVFRNAWLRNLFCRTA